MDCMILPSLLRTTNNLIASRSTFPRLLANSINGSTAMRDYSWICSDIRSIRYNKQQAGVVCCPGVGVGVCIASCTAPEGGIEDAAWMDEPLVPSPLLASHTEWRHILIRSQGLSASAAHSTTFYGGRNWRIGISRKKKKKKKKKDKHRIKSGPRICSWTHLVVTQSNRVHREYGNL